MEDLRLVTTEEFNGVDCNFYKADSNMWMTRGQIGKALGYHNPRIAIGKIHTAHRDRLDPLSVDTNLGSTDGKEYSTYIYIMKEASLKSVDGRDSQKQMNLWIGYGTL